MRPSMKQRPSQRRKTIPILPSRVTVEGIDRAPHRAFLRGLSNRVLELGGESGTEREPHAYLGSYVEYVTRTGHEAPGVHA